MSAAASDYKHVVRSRPGDSDFAMRHAISDETDKSVILGAWRSRFSGRSPIALKDLIVRLLGVQTFKEITYSVGPALSTFRAGLFVCTRASKVPQPR
jgi:hypothetical protein